MLSSRTLVLRSLLSVRAVAQARPLVSRLEIPTFSVAAQCSRSYASKGKGKDKDKSKDKESNSSRQKGKAPVEEDYDATTKRTPKSTDAFIPGSKQKIVDEGAQKEYEKADGVMKTAVDWFRKECAGYETRASGRVTPAILAPVRVVLPNDTTEYPLESLATVGVREGTTLLITLFDERNMKHVESALYTCGVPGVVPHKYDSTTIKIPIPKSTVEARHALYASAKKKAEEIRTQVRKQHSASLKRGRFGKHSAEIEEFQKLTDKYIAEIDKILKDLQKATGGK